MSAAEVIGLFLGAGLLGFLSSIITLWTGRRKNNAETNTLIQKVANDALEAQDKLQGQVDELRKRRDADEDAKAKLREELNRLHDDIETLRDELLTERKEKAELVKQCAEKERALQYEKIVNDNLMKQVRQLNDELNAARKKDDEIQRLERAYYLSQTTIKELQDKIASLEEVIAGLQKKIFTLENAAPATE